MESESDLEISEEVKKLEENINQLKTEKYPDLTIEETLTFVKFHDELTEIYRQMEDDEKMMKFSLQSVEVFHNIDMKKLNRSEQYTMLSFYVKIADYRLEMNLHFKNVKNGRKKGRLQTRDGISNLFGSFVPNDQDIMNLIKIIDDPSLHNKYNFLKLKKDEVNEILGRCQMIIGKVLSLEGDPKYLEASTQYFKRSENLLKECRRKKYHYQCVRHYSVVLLEMCQILEDSLEKKVKNNIATINIKDEIFGKSNEPRNFTLSQLLSVEELTKRIHDNSSSVIQLILPIFGAIFSFSEDDVIDTESKATLLYCIGRGYYHQNDLEKSIRFTENAILEAGSSSKFPLLVGDCLRTKYKVFLRQGEEDQAKKALREYLELDDLVDKKDSLHHHHHQGDKESEIEMFEEGEEDEEIRVRRKICSNEECQKEEYGEVYFKTCSRCKKTFYCSRECQIVHWKKGHREECL